MHELLLALALLAPATTPDLAPPTFQVPINSSFTGSDGKIYTFKGVLTLIIEEPLPAPPGPQITAMRNEAGQGVEQIRSGEVLVLEGVELWKEGAQIRVQIPGRTAAVLSFSAERLRVRFPAVGQPMEGPLQVYHNEGTGWVLVTTGPRITVLPAALPGRIRIGSFHRPDGSQLFSPFGEGWEGLKPGEPFIIRAEGLGEKPGKLTLSGWPAPVLSWSESEVSTVTPTLTWLRANTLWRSIWYPVDMELTAAPPEPR